MKNKPVYVSFLAVGTIGVLMVYAWLSSPTRAAPMIPPPIPTMTFTPAPKPTAAPVTGGLIELQVAFPSTWRWGYDQQVWTIVQWQDVRRRWRDVEGWQGTLDRVVAGENGQVTGYKTWWVSKSDVGRGPFRWLVYRNRDGALLVTSDSFYLPAAAGKIVRVKVVLK